MKKNNELIFSVNIKRLLILFVCILFFTCKKKNTDLEAQNNNVVVETRKVNTITDHSVICMGNVESNSNIQISKMGIIVCTNPINDTSTITSNLFYSLEATRTFQVYIQNLLPTTLYHYKAFVITTDGLVYYGADSTFTTLKTYIPSNSPIVSTDSITQITDVSIVYNAHIVTNGGSNILESGIVISRNSSFNLLDTAIINLGNTNTISGQLNNLLPSTIYYAKAYAKNNDSTGFGNTITFATNTKVTPDTSNIKISGLYNLLCDGFAAKIVIKNTITNYIEYGVIYSNKSPASFGSWGGGKATKITNDSFLVEHYLSYDTQYVRAYLITNTDTFYSNQQTILNKLPPDPRATTYTKYKLPKNQFVNYIFKQYGFSSGGRITNADVTNTNFILPSGINMYFVINSYTGSNISLYKNGVNINFQVGDSILFTPGTDMGLYAPTMFGNNTINFSIVIKGITTSDFFPCWYDIGGGSGNTFWKDYYSTWPCNTCKTY